MSRSGSVRLRSSLSKIDPDSGGAPKRRRVAGSGGNGQPVNGNGGNGSGRNGSRRGADIEEGNNSNTPAASNLEEQQVDNAPECSSSSSSDSSDSSDSEDSSEVDEGCSEAKCVEYKDDLTTIEKQFLYVRELLYNERLKNVEDKIEEVKTGKAKEYLSALEQLQENMRIRIEVAGKLRDFRTVNLENKFQAEELAALQNYHSEVALLFDELKSDVEEQITRLKADRNNDFTSELWLESALKRKNKKSTDIFGEKKKKPITVTGPYIVYMLNDVDIFEDWTTIKKALATPKRFCIDIPSY